MKDDSIYRSARINWEKSKDDAWLELSDRIGKEDGSAGRSLRLLPGDRWLAFAASIVLLLAVASFMRFHTTEEITVLGEELSLELPDGSLVEMNENSTLRYHRYWWFVSRSVELNGEAFFRVEKGARFRVCSAPACTEVLGTSFNIYARDEAYQVACHSGKVKVTSLRTTEDVFLEPGGKASLGTSGAFHVEFSGTVGEKPAWMDHMIMFTSTPLQLVFEEIERQYNVEIEVSGEIDFLYSGNFSVDIPLENALSLLCRPFNLNYDKVTGKKYIIHPSPSR